MFFILLMVIIALAALLTLLIIIKIRLKKKLKDIDGFYGCHKVDKTKNENVIGRFGNEDR